MMRDMKMSVRAMIIMLLVLANAIILRNGFAVGGQWYWGLLITVPLLVPVIVDIIQKKRAIMNTKSKILNRSAFLQGSPLTNKLHSQLN